jgi:ATP-dependent Clp protease ATP-binding subunit ClpA
MQAIDAGTKVHLWEPWMLEHWQKCPDCVQTQSRALPPTPRAFDVVEAPLSVFKRFTQDARRTLVRARHEAVSAGQSRIGCEHLLLALLAEPGPASATLTAAGVKLTALRAALPRGGQPDPDPLDAEALASVGIDLDAIRRATDAAFGPGALERSGRGRARKPGPMRLAADAKKALEPALRAAARLRHRQLSGAHLLIGIIDQGDNAALRLLAASGVNAAALRADLLARLATAA